MELKEEEKMLQVEETSGTEGQGAVSKPATGTDQIIWQHLYMKMTMKPMI